MEDGSRRGDGGDRDGELSQAAEYLAVLDAELRILFVNRAPAGLGDIVGRVATEFLPEEFQQQLREAAADALQSGRPRNLTTQAAGPDGESSLYSVWLIPATSGVDGARLTLLATDLTHRVRTEEALEEERSLLRSLVDNAPDYILILDREHRVRFINRIDRGFTQGMLIGHMAEDFVPPEGRARAWEAVESVFETGEGVGYEVEVDTPAGTFWYHSRIGPVIRDGRVVRVSLVATDITEAKRLERSSIEERASLAQSEARFRTMVDSAPEALVILDMESGVFVDANPRACDLFEYSREQLLQRGPIELSGPTAPDGRPAREVAGEYLAAAVRGEQPVFQWTHRTGSGREFPCELRLARLPHPERVLLRGSVIDISERVHAEQERARLNDELFQARKMQALGQLTGGVAHDFNNLLTVIMAHAELMSARAITPERAREHAGQVLQAAQRAANLTQQLLAFSRRQPLRPRSVDLAALVTGLEEMLRRTLGETIRVRTVLPAGLWTCEVDPTQMEHALLNLAINSRDAMPQGGALVIEAGNVHEAPREPGGAASPAHPHVMLCVRDTGLGMTPNVRAQAFEPFFTTKDVGKGSGLGLSMVYGFVNQSGGQVRITSAPGCGTEVAIYLPRSEHAADGQDAMTAGPSLARGRGELLLVVEDDAQVRAATVHALRQLGYRVLEAADAARAREVLAREPEVALLLSDVVLPGGVSGPQLVQSLRAERPLLPVVFMSGYPRDALVDGARLADDVVLLGKPFSHAELAAAIRGALAAEQ